MAELGFPDFEVTSWFGLLAPLKTPPNIVNQLSQAVQKAVAASDVQDLLAKQGATPAGGTPDQFAAFIRNENARMAKALKLSGFKKQ